MTSCSLLAAFAAVARANKGFDDITLLQTLSKTHFETLSPSSLLLSCRFLGIITFFSTFSFRVNVIKNRSTIIGAGVLTDYWQIEAVFMSSSPFFLQLNGEIPCKNFAQPVRDCLRCDKIDPFYLQIKWRDLSLKA